jgi:hypothetical protein
MMLLNLQSSVRRFALEQLLCLLDHVRDAQRDECIANLL